ncbi:hypothetical protein BKA67DRAFT_533462 [Truncatella angustata]|uniref:Uncharacterized protein n=1 Tax=Truncatella angustata TaxID=152316 RepID=A0A9P8UUA8_9PEZI|nr:uncharacterized protein BKA67DRAFT_533462 [Truncatella angustata]KAH6658306.1 hypothetical protein BKA67DRAFT_533462 [Truncatella angustata]
MECDFLTITPRMRKNSVCHFRVSGQYQRASKHKIDAMYRGRCQLPETGIGPRLPPPGQVTEVEGAARRYSRLLKSRIGLVVDPDQTKESEDDGATGTPRQRLQARMRAPEETVTMTCHNETTPIWRRSWKAQPFKASSSTGGWSSTCLLVRNRPSPFARQRNNPWYID